MDRVALAPLLFIVALLIPLSSYAQTAGNFLDMTYQSNSYTPPFYRGKALPSSETRVTIIATPAVTLKNKRVAKISDLTFTWEKDGLIVGTQSGLGKNTLIIKTEPLPGDATSIKVTARASDGTFVSNNVNVPALTPFILFYENDPLLGTRLEQATKNGLSISKPEISITAYPYFFETLFRNTPTFSYNWSLNGEPVNPQSSSPTDISVRRGETGGQGTLRLSIENSDKILESAVTSVSISFPSSAQSPF